MGTGENDSASVPLMTDKGTQSWKPLGQDNIPLIVACSSTIGNNLQQLAVSLALKCLTYDFTGTTIDESSEDFVPIQAVPGSVKSVFKAWEQRLSISESRSVIDPIASIFDRMLCSRSETSDEDSGYTLGGSSLPGSDPIEASRRSTASCSGIRINTFLVSQHCLFLTLVEIIVWKLMKQLKESISKGKNEG